MWKPEARRRHGVTVGVMGLVAVLAGCGSGADGVATSTGATSTTSAAASSSTSSAPSTSNAVAAGCASAITASMSLRDKLAAMLVVGVSGTEDARRVVDTYHVGGIFVGSFTDFSILADGRLKAIAARSKRPLMVTVDQEGGRVSRLSELGIDSPSARELAATSTPAEVRRIAARTGAGLKRLGITVDFAPDADVSDESDDEVIGDRSFSDDPAVVARYAGAFADGLRDAGVMPVFKHFPGHGHGSGDSHTGTVRTPPLSQLKSDDLVPYRTLLPGQATRAVPTAGVMVGHLIVPGLTGDELPASISAPAMRLLRTGTGYGGRAFDGPIFTDDLSGMAAISARYGIEEAVVRALTAGADLALWLSTDKVPDVLAALTSAVRAKRLSQAQVDRSVARNLRATGAGAC
ncbi:glycoside hydrolase family 3 N-terminal domain-containing protein [Williamsia sp.]|uniref:glycoside hydrolase family 3 N-terminal domain-containing protein n=1 Tax=Williamsia sp. TaxID=1872085 RepID=UPI0025D955C2|nr:glycoside hydrolase family 3 N-terminal domain-containing protein [Williamsia sp.]